MKKNVRIKLFKDNGRYNAPVFVGLNEYTALMMTRMAGEFEERAAAME